MSETTPTNQINYYDPTANMFGIVPCPKCGNTRRWPTQPTHKLYPSSILCDDCGFVEPTGKEVRPDDDD